MVAALAIAGVAGLTGFAGTGESSKPVTIGHVGMWTLHTLGYSDEVRHGTTADYGRPKIFFGLPAGAKQGPKDWYLVRLHMRVVIAPDSGPGKIDISATTDSAACGLIAFRVGRSTGGPTVTWTSVGIVDGVRSGTSVSGTIELRYANYLQIGGVRPGSNDLDFQISQHGSARVAEVRFLDDSGIEFSPLGPANVRLTAERASSAPVHVGQRFAVRVALRNRGERAARNIRVSVTYPTKLLSLVTPTPIGVVARLRHEALAMRQLVFVARRAGRAPIFVSAETSSNHPGDLATVMIRP